jgi:hypothetical protein
MPPLRPSIVTVVPVRHPFLQTFETYWFLLHHHEPVDVIRNVAPGVTEVLPMAPVQPTVVHRPTNWFAAGALGAVFLVILGFCIAKRR